MQEFNFDIISQEKMLDEVMNESSAGYSKITVPNQTEQVDKTPITVPSNCEVDTQEPEKQELCAEAKEIGELLATVDTCLTKRRFEKSFLEDVLKNKEKYLSFSFTGFTGERTISELKSDVEYLIDVCERELDYIVSAEGLKSATYVSEEMQQEDEFIQSEANDGKLGDTILSDILSGVNGGAFDYEFQDVGEEALSDGSEVGFKGTIINKSHVVTSLRKSGAIGVRAETDASRKLRESYIIGYREDGTPIYNFTSDGRIINFEELKQQGVFFIEQETKHMGTLYFMECSKEEARDMIIAGHYSHKFQGTFGKVNVGVYKEGRLLGVASFGLLMNPKSFKNFGDFKQDEVIELNRLWVDDELGMNTETMLLSASWKIMRRNYPEIKIVQSFADGRLGAGTIYKASNFKYYGVETTLFFQDKETGVIYHKVGIENTKAPQTFMRLNKMYCEGRLQQFRVNTYRYIFPLYKTIEVPDLDKEGKQKIKVINGMEIPMTVRKPLEIAFKEEPFPQYQRGQNMLENYVHPLQLLTRAYILARLLRAKDDNGVSYSDFFEWYEAKKNGKEMSFEKFEEVTSNWDIDKKNSFRKENMREWYNMMKASLANDTIREMRKDAENSMKGENTSFIADTHKLLEKEFKTDSFKNHIIKDAVEF